MSDKLKTTGEIMPSGQPQQEASSAIEPQAQPVNPDSLFFNVMPKAKTNENLVQPTLTSALATEAVAKEKLSAKDIWAKYRWFFIVGAIVLIGGPLIYFVLDKIGSSSYKPENFLANNSANVVPKTTTTTPDASQQVQGFTTDQKWRDKYFPNCTDASLCGDNADPDHDGLTNIQEFKLGTDPNNNDSDQDGLSDGDEANVFGTNPLSPHTANDPQYNDADYFKGLYDIGTGKKMSAAQIASFSSKMKQFGLHEPTIKTLFGVLNSVYNFSSPDATTTPTSTPASLASSTLPSNLDQSISAKQDRDTKRSGTINNIEAALVKYQTDNKIFPITNDFATMFANVKVYLKVATNPTDPINSAPYVYSYNAKSDGSDFSLSFFSEVASQIITKHAADAVKDSNAEQAAILDNQRQTDLESLRTALLLYSQNNIAGTQTYVFPSTDKYKTAIVPNYISQIPKDPKTGADYPYQVSSTFDTFTLKAVFDAPPAGTTGYLCNQEECAAY